MQPAYRRTIRGRCANPSGIGSPIVISPGRGSNILQAVESPGPDIPGRLADHCPSPLRLSAGENRATVTVVCTPVGGRRTRHKMGDAMGPTRRPMVGHIGGGGFSLAPGAGLGGALYTRRCCNDQPRGNGQRWRSFAAHADRRRRNPPGTSAGGLAGPGRLIVGRVARRGAG